MTKFFLAFIFLLLPLRILAQSPLSDAPRASLPCKINVQGRPSVGLALEGGVAYGLAHVGVLEWLEENHIPVDCVAGTSMGGLIGALYAMGYTLHPRKGDLDMNQFSPFSHTARSSSQFVPLPEPGTMTLLGTGIAALVARYRRRQRRTTPLR